VGILGADISLTAPGFAVLDSKDEAMLITSQSLKDFRGPERWEVVVENFKKILNDYVIELVVFEGYGFNSFRLGDLAELGGILRYLCYKKQIPFCSVPPATLKKSFTGSGKADKAEMMKTAFRLGFKCNNDNESDAVALARHGFMFPFESNKVRWLPKGKQIKLNI
jgi:Holliday junction resolvasome RuvABC endonuclease subunit